MAAPNGSHSNWTDQVPISVAPLNCVPYTGPPLDHFDTENKMAQNNEAKEKNEPIMIFFPAQTPEKEVYDALSVAKNGVAVSGSALRGKIGPLIGSVDISESDDAFLFRVALPGVENNEKFKCDIKPDGTITIEGVTSTGEKTVHSHNMVFEMHTQNLAPPGDFSVSFQLSAHVDPTTSKHMLANGVLEGIVKKKPTQS